MTKKAPEAQPEREMPFLEHLEELRWRLIRSIVGLVLASILAFVFKEQILAFLMRPFQLAAQMHAAGAAPGTAPDAKLIYLAPIEVFMVYIKLALFAGLFISSPYIFYQLWKFIAPGLLKNEKKYVPYFVGTSTFFFLAGAYFCYAVVLRYTLFFLLDFQTPDLQATFAIKEYLRFVTMLLLMFGIVFEMPILTFFLTRIGLLTPRFMREKRRYGIVLIFVVAAIMTPPDPLSQMLLGIPLLLLYEFSIIVCRFAQPAIEEEPALHDPKQKPV